MPRPSNTEERRAQIVHAMVRVVARLGYEGASMQDIAHEAGLATGLLHYHFENKLSILLALQEHILERHLARLQRWMDAESTPLAKVGAFLDCHLARGAEEDPDALACWIALTAEALRVPAVRRGFDRGVRALVAVLSDAIADARKSETLHEVQPEASATALFALIQGYYALHGASPGLIPRGSAAAATHRMAAGLLGVSEESLRCASGAARPVAAKRTATARSPKDKPPRRRRTS